MTGAEVARIVSYLEDAGIPIWLDGGWGVDALLGEETRAHSDLDAAVELDNTDSIVAALTPLGFQVEADDRPTRLVLAASDRRRVDLHPLVFDELGNGKQIGAGPNGGDAIYPAKGLSGKGMVGGRTVACLTAELLLRHHMGYEPTSKDRHNVRLLCERFGLPTPRAYAGQAVSKSTSDRLD
jgi:lincosamide nucleotidyltransferase A/C/D/E